ncbi:hypothetical protein ACN27G_27460 [Plantactinospora sp. WMMB334]|uniref:hypothetical protein n=1 Tax=Plantactinospora sp. WMMB334 TaxID=3404119 RepID=UPI003B953791
MTLAPVRPHTGDVAFVPPQRTRVPAVTPCPLFCDRNHQPDPDGSIDHSGEIGELIAAHDNIASRDVETAVTAYRLDIPGQPSMPEVLLDIAVPGQMPYAHLSWTPTNARRQAGVLVEAADMVDPLPVGETWEPARHVRVGDEILTGDGWQHVYMLLICERDRQVSLWTPERDGDTDGWEYDTADLIRVRRPSGTLTIPAQEIRYDDHLLTSDGWQAVEVTTVDAKSKFVAVFTEEKNADDSDGWQFGFGDEITVRRVAR